MPRISGSHQGDGIQAVLLAFGILEFLAQQRGAVGVTDLSQHFGTTKSRVHRHLQTLMVGGYVTQDEESERYRVSARLMAMGEVVGQNFDLPAVARPAMDDLRARLGHSVAVSVPEKDGTRIVAVVRGGSNAEIGVRPGSLLPLHASAQGKLCLAYGSRDLRQKVISAKLERPTPHTITDGKALDAEISAVKARGWATAAEEAVVGLNALAAPVFGAFGECAGAIAIVDSIQFIAKKPNADQIRFVVAAAEQVSGALGAREAS